MDNNIEEMNISNDEVHMEPQNVIENEPKKNKFKMPIIIIVIILLLGSIGVFAANAMMKSEGEKVVKLLGKNQKIVDVLELEDEPEQVNMKMEFNLKEIAGDSLDVGNIILEAKEINQKDDFSFDIMLGAEKMKEKFELQIVKDGDLLGINIPEVTEKFIGIDMDDIEGLMANMKKLGIDIDMEQFSTEDAKENKEKMDKLEKLLPKYVELLKDEIKQYAKKVGKEEIEISDNTIKATKHELIINGEVLAKTALKLEKELLKNKKDIETLVELGFIEDKDKFVETLEQERDRLEEIVKEESYDDVFDGEFKLYIYEKNGKCIATVLEIDEVRIGFYTIEKDDDKFEIILSFEADGEQAMIIIEIQKEENIIKGSISLSYKEETMELLEVEVEKFAHAEDEILTIKKDEILLLNEADEDDLEEFANEASENLESFLEKMMG